jgi:class 3 adenylate cyclase
VASAAHGGQVLVSGTARALAGDPGEGITLRDLGEHRL